MPEPQARARGTLTAVGAMLLAVAGVAGCLAPAPDPANPQAGPLFTGRDVGDGSETDETVCASARPVEGQFGVADVVVNEASGSATLRDVRLVDPVNLRERGALAGLHSETDSGAFSWFSAADWPYRDGPPLVPADGLGIPVGESASVAVEAAIVDPPLPASVHQQEVSYDYGDHEFTELTGVSHR